MSEKQIRNFPNASLLRVLATLLALACWASSAMADWNLVPAGLSATANVEFNSPAVLHFQILNSGDQPSPALDLQAGSGAPLLPLYDVTAQSGECGPWRDESLHLASMVSLPVTRFSIPPVAPGAQLRCSFRVSPRTSNSRNVTLAFGPVERFAATAQTAYIGQLTDLGATATLLSSTTVAGLAVDRYRLQINNYSAADVGAYGVVICSENIPSGFLLRNNFPGACASGGGLWCFGGSLGITPGPVAPYSQASCDFETQGPSAVALSIFRISDRIYRAGDARPLLDSQPNSNRLQIGTPAGFASQIPTLSLNGLIALALGIVLGTFAAREHAN